MIVRAETVLDVETVFSVNSGAFETPAEARLVDSLRERAKPVISLVAELDGQIVGHLMMSPVSLTGYPELKLMGLAPMAVRPEFQRKGIGSELVRAGIDRCRDLEVAAIIVLGHPEFYPRFGFLPASQYGIDSKYDVPDDVFMLLELKSGRLDGKTGRAAYHAAFDEL